MEPATISGLQDLFKNAVTAIIALAGVVLFVMLIIGGVRYVTSGGDPKSAEGARNTITYAIGGLVLVLISYLILVIIGQITGATNITHFQIVQ